MTIRSNEGTKFCLTGCESKDTCCFTEMSQSFGGQKTVVALEKCQSHFEETSLTQSLSSAFTFFHCLVCPLIFTSSPCYL